MCVGRSVAHCLVRTAGDQPLTGLRQGIRPLTSGPAGPPISDPPSPEGSYWSVTYVSRCTPRPAHDDLFTIVVSADKLNFFLKCVWQIFNTVFKNFMWHVVDRQHVTTFLWQSLLNKIFFVISQKIFATNNNFFLVLKNFFKKFFNTVFKIFKHRHKKIFCVPTKYFYCVTQNF